MKKSVEQNSEVIARKYNTILDSKNSLAINILFGTWSAPSGIDTSNVIVVQEDSEEEDQCSYDVENDDKYSNDDNTEIFNMDDILNILNSIEDSIDDGDENEGTSLLDISKDWFDISGAAVWINCKEW